MQPVPFFAGCCFDTPHVGRAERHDVGRPHHERQPPISAPIGIRSTPHGSPSGQGGSASLHRDFCDSVSQASNLIRSYPHPQSSVVRDGPCASSRHSRIAREYLRDLGGSSGERVFIDVTGTVEIRNDLTLSLWISHQG
jgi:hypothetical protein